MGVNALPARAERRARPRGLARRRTTWRVRGLAVALGIAVAVAVAGCSGSAGTGPTHLTSHQLVSKRSCLARRGWATITLTDTLPGPVVTVTSGARLVVIVPRWTWGTATPVQVARSGILRQQCTVLLPRGGRRTIFLAVRPGSTRLGATVEPASNLAMPAWGGRVIVRARS